MVFQIALDIPNAMAYGYYVSKVLPWNIRHEMFKEV